MFFNEHFTHFTFFGVEEINFGNFWDKIFFKINGMIEGSVGRKLIVSGFSEHISKVRAKGGDEYVLGLFRDGEFCRYGDFVNVFFLGRILMKRPLDPRRQINREVNPIDNRVPFLESGHAEDNLRARETNNHELILVRERTRVERNVRDLANGPLGVRGSIYIEGCDWSRESFEFKNTLWKKTRVDEISGGSGVDECKGVNGFFKTM